MRHARRRGLCECKQQQRNMTHISSDVRERSPCTWIYETDYNQTRIPACIHRVAACIKNVQQETENQCEKINVLYPVRHQDGLFWVDEWLEVSVACVLVPSHVYRQPSLTPSGAHLHFPLPWPHTTTRCDFKWFNIYLPTMSRPTYMKNFLGKDRLQYMSGVWWS